MDKEKFVQELKEKINSIPLEQRVIISHSGNDGLITTFSLVSLFGKCDIEFSKTPTNKFIDISDEKRLVFLADILLTKSQLEELLQRELIIIDFNHNMNYSINHKHYFSINPKKIFGKENISSSGMIYLLFKEDEFFKEKIEKIEWLFGIGPITDVCYEDCLEILTKISERYPELLNLENNKSILKSKLFELSQIFSEGNKNPEKILSFIENIVNYGLTYHEIYKEPFFLEWVRKNDVVFNNISAKKIPITETKKFVFVNSTGKDYAGSYSLFLNLLYNDERTYIEYASGKIYLNNLFGQCQNREIAKSFDSHVGNQRFCEAYSQKNFEKMMSYVVDTFEKKNNQAKLF
ncbi:hypothetical protein J4465_02155 [Candidatus Pacearchaeota archaeon]|nr:hypothetical protein [Candidatus Pacearchaeota archaeon]